MRPAAAGVRVSFPSSTARMMAMSWLMGTGIILPGSHRLRTQNVVEVVFMVPVGPFLYDFEHVAVGLVAVVADGGMVEYRCDVVEDLVNGNIGVVEGVDDAGGDILEDGGGDLAGGFVEDVGEVVLGEHGVCGIWVLG